MNIEELNHRLKDAALEYLTDEQKLIAAYTSGYNDGISLSQWAELNKPVEKTPFPDPAPDVRDERRKHLDSLDIAPAFPANRSRITNKGKTKEKQ